ncbi:MAG: hypothetical protein L6R43_05025 [Planctomycetes bacterium]|nr:hypothetical protein [Planctomycetota bacterium]
MGGVRGRATLLASLPLLLAACTEAPPVVLGGPGVLDRPRALAARDGIVAVVDTSGSLRRLTADGAPAGSHPVMPPGARRGYPLGVLLREDGSATVVHTHDSALVHYARDGRETGRFGDGGVKDGQFCMPQRALRRGEEWIVSEFGYEECRRVQVFDAAGRFLRRIGGPGTDAVFERPMGMALDAAGVLWVADASHFLLRFDPATGRLLGKVGGPGDGPGRLRWPTGVAALPGGGVVVCEAGNHRLQRFDAEGRSLGTFGRPGAAPGEFRGPYDLAVDPPFLFVADTENHRIQRFRLDALPWSVPADPAAAEEKR